MIYTLKPDTAEALVASQTLTWVGSHADPDGGADFIVYTSFDLTVLDDTYQERLEEMKRTGPPAHIGWIQRITQLSGDQARLALRFLAHGNDMEAALNFADAS